MKEGRTLQTLISMTLVLALVASTVPTTAFAAEEVPPQDELVATQGGDPMLGVQTGLEEAQPEGSGQPRSREELLALDSVILSEDGEPVAVEDSAEEPITTEELAILFDIPAVHSSLSTEQDLNRELREQFSLTDAQIEAGTDLHGNRLAYTNELGDLVIRAEGMDLTSTQVEALADLISAGYTYGQAIRALVSRDLFNFMLDELKTARADEIRAARLEDELELAEQDWDDADYLSNELGLPKALADEVLETSGKDVQTLVQEMDAAMETAYPAPDSDEPDAAVFAAAGSGGTDYVPEEVLGQPYRYDQQGNFDINLNTGAYSYTETDLSIPGKNGLDLVLTRQYHSDRANVMQTYGSYAYAAAQASKEAFKVYYRWYELKYSEKNDDYIFYQELTDRDGYRFRYSAQQEKALEAYTFSLSDYDLAIKKRDSMIEPGKNRISLLDSYGVEHIIKLVPDIVTEGRVFENNINNVSCKDSYYVDMFGLGHGWMLGLSHLQWVLSGYGDWDNLEDKHIQLVLSNGTRYNIAEDDSTIENYKGEDIRFHRCGSAEYLNAEYALYYKDGKVEYFNHAGQNIAIRDRFGNTIKISYVFEGTRVKKIQIMDTVGNLIVHEEVPLSGNQTYQLEGKTYNKMWQLSLNGTVIRTYYSYCQSKSLPEGLEPEPTTLVGVKNEAGEVTLYDNTITTVCYNSFLKPAKRQMAAKERVYDNDGYDMLVEMRCVTYPNGAEDKLSVIARYIEQFGTNGYRHYSRCKGMGRMNSAFNTSKSVVGYEYGDFDGLEGRTDGNYYTEAEYHQTYPVLNGDGTPPKTYKSWKNYNLVYTFNAFGQNVKIRKRSYYDKPGNQNCADEIDDSDQASWLSETTEYTYWDDSTSWPRSIKTTYKDNESTTQMTRSEAYTYDNKGNVLTYTKPNGETGTYTYDDTYSLPLTTQWRQNDTTTIVTTNTLSENKKSILATEVTSNGVLVGKTTYEYDASGQLLARKDYQNADKCVTTTCTYNYDIGALPVQVTVNDVHTTVSSNHAISTPGLGAGNIGRRQTYNERGWLMTETDANGNTTSYTYDAVGRPVKVTYPDGKSLSYSYDVKNNAVTYTDRAGNRWKCTYGKSGKLLTVTDLTSNQVLQSNTYDQYDQLVKKVVYGGTTPDQTTYYRYDTDGHLVELSCVDEFSTTIYQERYEYKPGAGKIKKEIVGGHESVPSIITTSYQDNMGNIVKTGVFRNGVEEIDAFAYDYLGNQVQVKSAYSASKGCAYTTASTYDHAGRLLSVSDASGNTAAKTYDWMGNQLTEVTPKNNTNNNKTRYETTYSYDELGRLISKRTPIDANQSGMTTYTYDANGNVIQESVQSQGGGRSTDYFYDVMNRLTQVRGNAARNGTSQYQYTQYTYDDLGNIAQMSVGGSGAQQTTQYTYDRYSRLIQRKDALDHTETYAYALNGLLTSKTDRRGVTTVNTYDAMGRLDRSMAGSDSLAFSYNRTGKLAGTSVNNEEGTDYRYNDAGDLIKEITPVATKTMTYGVGGFRTGFTVTAGNKTYLNNQYSYNKLGYLVKVNSGNVEAHYSYDSNGNLTNVTNGNDTTASYTYNKADLVTEIKNKRDKVEMSTFKYTYSADGNQLSKTDSRGSQTNYAYDGLNRLTQESQTGTYTFDNTYTYDDYGNRSSMLRNDARTTYFYDQNNALCSTVQIDGSNMESIFYSTDAQGNMTSGTMEYNTVVQWSFGCTYDGFNRLEKVSDSNGATVYTYDADGHRIMKKSGNKIERYVWDGDQLVVTIAGANQLMDFTISEKGMVTVEAPRFIVGKQYYALINGKKYSATAEYVSGDDMAVALSEQPELPPTTDYPRIVLDFGPIALEVDFTALYRGAYIVGTPSAHVQIYEDDPGSETGVTTYIRGLGLIASRDDNAVTYYHYDAHGDVVQTTTAWNAVKKDYFYDAFGVELDRDDTDTNPFRYCGEQFDSETGNYYLRARYYTPGTGRFTQEDPAQDGSNWYVYCAGNPVRFVDPSGYAKQIELEFSVAGAAADLELQVFGPVTFGQSTNMIRTLLPIEGNQAYMNYLYNQRFSVSGLINGQQLAPVSDFRYGVKTMSWNGCEVIANYNALILLGNPHELNDVANWGENHGQIFNGFFGTWPDSSRALFEELGYSVTSVDDVSQFDSKAANADVCIFTFWNDYHNPFMGAHTIAIKPTKNGFEAYNFYGKHTDTYSFTTFADMIETKQWHFKPIILYCISGGGAE